eukprot:gene27173-biopygen17718
MSRGGWSRLESSWNRSCRSRYSLIWMPVPTFGDLTPYP